MFSNDEQNVNLTGCLSGGAISRLGLSKKLIGRFFHPFQLDYSKFPKLSKEDVEEKVAKGSGPGGQSVNKTSNAIRLKHLPTGAAVRCHETRSLEKNRQIAWKKLAEVKHRSLRLLFILATCLFFQEVDFKLNREDSIREQARRLEKELKEKREESRRRQREAKRLKKLQEEGGGGQDGGDEAADETPDKEDGPSKGDDSREA